MAHMRTRLALGALGACRRAIRRGNCCHGKDYCSGGAGVAQLGGGAECRRNGEFVQVTKFWQGGDYCTERSRGQTRRNLWEMNCYSNNANPNRGVIKASEMRSKNR